MKKQKTTVLFWETKRFKEGMRLANLFFKEIIAATMQHDVAGVAAEGAYRAVMSFFPFLMVTISVLSHWGKQYNLQSEVLNTLERFLLPNSINLVRGYLKHLLEMPSRTIASLSLVAFIWLGTAYFLTLSKGVSRAYEVSRRSPFKDILIGFLLFVFAGSFLLVFSTIMLVGPITLEILQKYIEVPSGITMLLGKLRFLASILGLILLLAIIYHISLPRRSPWRSQLPGAIAAGFAWVIATGIFSTYLQRFGSYEKTYGSLAGVIIFLVWLYISNIIYILGAEVNRTLELLLRGKLPRKKRFIKGLKRK